MPNLPVIITLILLAPCAHTSSALAQTLTSLVDGLEITALTDLPPAPSDQGDRDLCGHKLVESPQTSAGAFVAAKGWAVTSEQAFGQLTAVTFVSGFIQGTSGTCELRDGNLGLFSGMQPVALVYAVDSEKILIGTASPFGPTGLRLWSGDYLPAPLADIQPTGTDITVTPLAASEPVCNGTAEVPFIYGMSLTLARQKLMQAGWQPVPFTGDRSEGFGLAPDIAAAGAPEVEDCSGTGFGFCSYAYAGPAGTLSVVTIGEFTEDGSLPVVSDYGADCR